MRRTLSLLAGLVAATTCLAGCASSHPVDSQAQALVGFGGPAGWGADQATQRPTDDTRSTTVDGVPVVETAGDQPAGVRIRWASSADETSAAQRCGQLVTWFDHAAEQWPSTIDTSAMAATCRADLAKAGDPVIEAGAGPAHGAYGRVTYEASVDDGRLVATLEFNARA